MNKKESKEFERIFASLNLDPNSGTIQEIKMLIHNYQEKYGIITPLTLEQYNALLAKVKRTVLDTNSMKYVVRVLYGEGYLESQLMDLAELVIPVNNKFDEVVQTKTNTEQVKRKTIETFVDHTYFNTFIYILIVAVLSACVAFGIKGNFQTIATIVEWASGELKPDSLNAGLIGFHAWNPLGWLSKGAVGTISAIWAVSDKLVGNVIKPIILSVGQTATLSIFSVCCYAIHFGLKFTKYWTYVREPQLMNNIVILEYDTDTGRDAKKNVNVAPPELKSIREYIRNYYKRHGDVMKPKTDALWPQHVQMNNNALEMGPQHRAILDKKFNVRRPARHVLLLKN